MLLAYPINKGGDETSLPAVLFTLDSSVCYHPILATADRRVGSSQAINKRLRLQSCTHLAICLTEFSPNSFRVNMHSIALLKIGMEEGLPWLTSWVPCSCSQ